MDSGGISQSPVDRDRTEMTLHSFDPWPWFVTGPVISIVMVTLLLIGKRFGLSSNLRTLCSVAGAGKFAEYFRFDWRSQTWNLVFVAGTIAGGAIAKGLMLKPEGVALNPETANALKAMGIEDAGTAYAPSLLFGADAWNHPLSLLLLVVGGVLVGFGTRWANGCTSGHAISGLSSLQWPSLIAVVGFFTGGLFVSYFILPTLLPLL
jgi:uncharacterized membrane protein YedE/YeeE